jgi:glycosyltransferase involved in cell wall biosynthesis
VGRLVPIKDVATLLHAFAELRRTAPAARLVVAGDGELRADLERLAASLGVGSAVTFTGWRLDLENIYSAVDAVVLSSLNEGTPVALIEAMAAARPVVATDVGGVPDVVTHEHTGLLVPPGAPSELARAMARLAADAGLRRRLGAAGRARVAQRFGTARLVDDIAGLYVERLEIKRHG